MKARVNSFLFAIIFIFAFACERIKYFPDNPIDFAGTRLLAHQGGGYYDRGNTMDACKYGLSRMDGIEIDLQRSSSNTIWLSHDTHTIPCGSIDDLCFPSTGDHSIEAVNACLDPTNNYPTLEEVFDYVSKNYPDKFISLDVKAWDPCGTSINIIKEMNDMGKRIIELVSKYHLENRVMVESEVGDFLYYMKKNTSTIETYLVTLGDFELGSSRALDGGFDGISFQFLTQEMITKEQVELLHRKGLKIQLWTIDEPDAMTEAASLGVDFVQTNYF